MLIVPPEVPLVVPTVITPGLDGEKSPFSDCTEHVEFGRCGPKSESAPMDSTKNRSLLPTLGGPVEKVVLL